MGNQLFKYAAAYALAKRLDADIWLQGTYRQFFDVKKHKRSFVLDQYNIVYHRWVPFYDLFLLFKKTSYVSEANFEEQTQEQGNLFYLKRLYESEYFFRNVQKEIKTFFTLKKSIPRSHAYLEHLKKIKDSPNSVAIHIRLGDYLSIEKRVLPLTYVTAAMNLFLKKEARTHFYIFSDAPQTVKYAFANLENVHILSGKSLDPVEDFELMRACNHHVIANSTFSWWAAWLNENTSQKVIAPFPRYNYSIVCETPFLTKLYNENFYPPEWELLNPFSVSVAK